MSMPGHSPGFVPQGAAPRRDVPDQRGVGQREADARAVLRKRAAIGRVSACHDTHSRTKARLFRLCSRSCQPMEPYNVRAAAQRTRETPATALSVDARSASRATPAAERFRRVRGFVPAAARHAPLPQRIRRACPAQGAQSSSRIARTTANSASSRSCSAIWSTRRGYRRRSIRKTCEE